MAGSNSKPDKPRRRRWRVFRALTLAGALVALLLAAAATVAYQRRVELVNRYLASSGLPFDVSVGTLDIHGLSFLALDQVQLRLPGAENPFLTFSSSAGNLSVPDLLDGHIADLHIANANVIIDNALLEALTGTPRPGGSNPRHPAHTLLISKLELENAQVSLVLDGLPAISFQLDHRGESIHIAGGLPVAGPQELHVSNLRAALGADTALEAPELSLKFSSAGDAGGLYIESLELGSLSVNLTQQLLDRFAPDTPPGETPPPPPPLPFPVTIDSLALENIRLASPAGLDLPFDLPFDLPAGDATLSVVGGKLQIDTDRTITAAPQNITASATLGDLLVLRSLYATVTTAASAPTIVSLAADTHIDFPAAGRLPATTADVHVHLADLNLPPGGPASTSSQSLNVTNLSASLGNSQAEIGSLIATLRPDTFRSAKRIGTLHIDAIRLNLDPADLTTAPGPSTPPTAPSPPPSPPRWHGIAVTDLSLTGGTLESSPAPDRGIPGATSSFEVATTAKTPENSTYRTTLNHLRLTTPTETLATVRSVTLDADPASVWSRNHLTRLAVEGVNLTVGQAIIDATRPPGATTRPPAITGSPAWTLGELDLSQSTVIIDDLIPGLPPLPLAISTTLTDIPLSGAGLEAASQPQSVTVSNARLRSRLNPLLDVARFDDVTLHFTFHDLVRKKIDRIAIEHPILFVGEHLFWYVDYFRKFEAPAAAATVADAPPAPGWDVRVVEANNGELVLAPKGAPLTELPKLPFSGKTRIVDSKLSFAIDSEGESGEDVSGNRPLLSLSVPEGDYPLKSLNLGLDVDLKGLRGDIAFNLPIQQRTNNLVQTLHADELWFKNLGAKKVYLAVTYDQQGIYAQFGGEAYGGYAEGAFNLYNDDAYSWDGWVAGTTISLAPLTSALTPEYLDMTGTADAKFIAQGDFESFDNITANGSLTTAKGGGKIDILALGDIGESLAEDAAPIAAALTSAGLDVVRYFEYDTAEVQLEMFGREGDASLDLRGPSGLRHIDITAHDYRNPTTTNPTP